MINVVERFCVSKTGIESDNEDGIYISEKFVAVIDGATSKEAGSYKGLTGGQIVRNIIIDTLGKMTGREDCIEAIAMIQKAIEKEFPYNKFFHASASAVIYNISQHCIWMIGDCQAMVNGDIHTNKKVVDDILSQARAMALTALIMDGEDENQIAVKDVGRELILPFLKLQRLFENRMGYYGYLTFNNESIDRNVLSSKVVVVEVPEKSEVILASDGYPCLMSTLAESEKELARLIEVDPFCYKKNISTKGIRKGNISYDDRTYIRLIV